MYFVYKHVNKINNKIYVGITKRKPELRWGVDGRNYTTSPHFYSAIKKYGWDNFEHVVLFEGLTQLEASEKEKELIKQFNSNNPDFGYNCTTGGELSFELNDMAKEKKAKAMIGNKNGSHPCSGETKEKIRQSQLGKTLSAEHIEKLKQAAKNRKSPPCSEDKKIKLQNSHPNMKAVYCFETNTVYKSVQDCGRQLEIGATSICAVCKGKHKAHKGYHFAYVNSI